MADLFFYGTLRYAPLLELVLGRSGADLDAREASLAGHGIFAVQGQIFPAIEERSDHVAQGVLVRGLSKEGVTALNFYEGGFDYDLKDVAVITLDGQEVAAQVYFPEPGLWKTEDAWDLQGWISEWGALTLRAAQEVMSYQGRMSAAEVATCFPSIRIRAAAWLAAQARSGDSDHDLSKDVVVHNHKRAHLNFFAMEEMDLQYRRYDGSLSPVINRAAALVGHAAVVLPYDPVRDEVLLVEQFRAATYIAGEQRPWMWEPVSGLIDPGETAEQAARREAMEEAGVTLSALEPVAQVYPSSGASGEFIHIFVGVGDLTKCGAGGGLAAEGEDIRSKIIGFDELMAEIDAQSFLDMPLVTAALWLARHRARLRDG
ncbi:tellurium resistance protein [Sedimentitalea sp. CY04]|uniref:ADP-ribose pyrophosphatase n=1 Tax=Parasedimentitalea denitrificans TaxID=2211118 RepID=A0ABX0WAL2_9RHOB|nr:NUDIX domain-containing protein [Sedimentitalea sp. CY04]NIZ62238.1 tellurium resistance protein [Sedimentitalea sp. CY04]